MKTTRFVRVLIAVCAVSSVVMALANGLSASSTPIDIAKHERARVLAAAGRYVNEKPITVTASQSPRSAGGLHDFFSEGDYWWPDPSNPDGPYIQRDGMSNPANFDDHR